MKIQSTIPLKMHVTHLGIEGGESLLVVHNQVEVQRALVVPLDPPAQQEGDSHTCLSFRREGLAIRTAISGEKNEQSKILSNDQERTKEPTHFTQHFSKP